jgi:two-component system sensor histidine kinase KdpD
MVERATGVVMRETVPDTFVRQADQVVTLDIAVEDLIERLRAGKIYAEDKIGWALEHFFKDHNLTTLRELVLREVAESVERSAAPAEQGESGRVPPTTGKVMVCMSSYSPVAAELVRRGSRIAGRLSSDWYVVYVETPDEAPELIDATHQRHLHDNIALARDLGAEVVRLKASEVVPALLEFARSHDVGHIIIGRSHAPWWRRKLGIDQVHRMLRASDDMDLHIVSLREREAR